MTNPLTCEGLGCHRESWYNGTARVRNLSASFARGEFSGITGPDGCGKGLLLNLLGLLEPPDEGEVFIGGHATSRLSTEDAQKLRNENYGFLFNHPCLLASFSVAENVAIPLFRVCGGEAKEARDRTVEALGFCGVSHLECELATRLNPHERRTVAFARAIVHHPDILIIISPGGGPLLPLLARRAADELGMTVLWAGPENEIAPFAHRILRMEEGSLLNEARP